MAGEPLSRKYLDREIARARSATRVLPWSAGSALAGGVLVWVAGGGLKGGLAATAVGLLFTAYLWFSSAARCPACGERLPSARKGPGPRQAGPADAERIQSCPRCRTRFE
jgi:hypothetical protein